MSQQYSITAELNRPFLIGRDASCDAYLKDPTVSRKHAKIYHSNEGWILEDLSSSTGTWIHQQRIQSQVILGGELIRIGLQHIHLQIDQNHLKLVCIGAKADRIEKDFQTDHLYTIGRDNQSDFVVAHPQCPLKLATIQLIQKQAQIQWVHSSLFAKKSYSIKSGETLTLPWGSLELQDTIIAWQPAHVGLNVTLDHLNLKGQHRTILQNIHLKLQAGELLCIIGMSGQGKSSLLKCMSGRWTPHQGSIQLDGLPPQHRSISPSIAWLKQDAPLRDYLTVKETLIQQMQIRLPQDLTKAERQGILQDNIQLMALQDVVDSRIYSLSGGERRRTALAGELLAKPGLLLLDEPFAGLDPASCLRLANWLRQISWRGHTLAVTTHDMTLFSMADKVLVLHQGFMAYQGTPDQALGFFNSPNAESILHKIRQRTGEEWNAAFLQSRPGLASRSDETQLSNSRKTSLPMETPRSGTLTLTWDRFIKSCTRDRGRLLALILQPLIIAALFQMIFSKQSSGWVAAFALNMASLWFALSAGIREIIQEKERVCEELRGGMSLPYYIVAKVTALYALILPQSVICAISLQWALSITLNWPALLASLSAGVLSTLGLSLLASAWVKTPNQANAVLPLILIPQLMFAGAVVPLDQMSFAGTVIAHTMGSFYFQSSLQDLFTANPVHSLDLFIPMAMALVFVIIAMITLKSLRDQNP